MKDKNDNIICDFCGKQCVNFPMDSYIDNSDNFAVHYRCWFEAIKDKVKKAVYDAKLNKATTELLTDNSTLGKPSTNSPTQPNWKTKDGKLMLISDMTDSHLLAAANKLKTNAVTAVLNEKARSVQGYLGRTKYNFLLEEIKKRRLFYEENTK